MANTIIETRGLTKRYGALTAVDDLNLEVRQGEIFGLLGPNGAGKTTTTLMLLGLTEPTAGTATIAGVDCTRNPIQVKRIVGYLPDNMGFYPDMTGRQNLRMTGAMNGLSGDYLEARIDELTARVGMVEAVDRKAGTYNLLRPDRELFTDLFSRLDRAALMPPDTRRMLGGFLLGELLTYVAAFAGDRICYIGGEHMPPLVEQLLQFIHEHLTEPLNLDILSEQVFLTKSHISRVFKAAMGIAPMEYITRKRIQLARQYLHEGEGAEDTAARCGFGDYSSFYRAYRRIIGRSPSQAEPTTKGEDAREKHTGSQGRAL